LKVLLVGSGGRELRLPGTQPIPAHRTALDRSGNPGTPTGRQCGYLGHDVPALVDFARQNQVDLVVVGPKPPGSWVGRRAGFGRDLPCLADTGCCPIETSKSFAKQFMQRTPFHGALTALTSFQPALITGGLDYPVVIKASGLAAGKGVLLPNGRTKLARPYCMLVEVSLARPARVSSKNGLRGKKFLAGFTDGKTIRVMRRRRTTNACGWSLAQYRGMGAYAPPDLSTEMQTRMIKEVCSLRWMVCAPRMPSWRAVCRLIFTPSGPRC